MIKQIPDITELATLPSELMERLVSKVQSLSDWGEQRSVQYRVHAATRSIEVVRAPLEPDFYDHIEHGDAFELLQDEVAAIEELLTSCYRFVSPKIGRFLLVNLPAEESVKRHRDYGPSLMVGARIHLPIMTNEETRIWVGDSNEHLQAGVMYEINNSQTHAVDNDGETDRIHAIIDFYDMHHVDRQVEYVMSLRGRKGKEEVAEKDEQSNTGVNSSQETEEGVPALAICGGQVQERISQEPLPTHLFVLSPNNSGSTLLTQYIGRCSDVARLPAEGQFMKCFRGPNPVSLGVKHLFTEKRAEFENPSSYDWDAIKEGWNRHWYASGVKSVNLEKSPTGILRADQLLKHFPYCRFLILTRDPYAVVEGISRRLESDEYERIARHVFESLRVQKANCEAYADISLRLRYEDICDDPYAAERQLGEFLGALIDVDFSDIIHIKDYHQRVENLNSQQISRLPSNAIGMINREFDAETCSFFGYELRKGCESSSSNSI